jgi:outer membrane protein assembly factor BamD (BamD/ComL family)
LRALITILTALFLFSSLLYANEGRNLVVKDGGGSTHRFALVIGNDSYQHVTPLRNARADARAISTALEKSGFNVTLLLDASDNEMKKAVRQFKNRLGGGDEAVFYFSGHGIQLGSANYLLPIDIHGDSEDQVKDEALPLQRVLDDLQDQKTRFSLAVIDACRNNPFKSSGRAIGGRGLTPTSPATGQMVLYSAGAGQQALDNLGEDDKNPNGLFTRTLLKEMEKTGVSVDKVLRNVREEVVREAKSINHEQVPAIYDQSLGEFYFRVGKGETGNIAGDTEGAKLEPVLAAVPTRIKSLEEIEQAAWESANESDNLYAIQEYLKQYPQGRFVGQANVIIATMRLPPAKSADRTMPPVRDAEEVALWDAVQNSNNKDDFEAYLTKYPKGKHAALARSYVKKLKSEASAEANSKEQDAWNTADRIATVVSYQDYLNSWPDGRYTPLANRRILKLQSDIVGQQEQEIWQNAEAAGTAERLQSYLDKYPSGGHATAAREKLAALRATESKFGKRVNVGFFGATNQGQKILMCRGYPMIATPDGHPFSELVRTMLVDELKFANTYSTSSNVTLTGNLDSIDVNSFTGVWDMTLTVKSSNGKSLSISQNYSFNTGLDGDIACKHAARTLRPAVQSLVDKVRKSPGFLGLAE